LGFGRCTLTASLGGHGPPSDAVIENSSAPGYPGYLYVSSSGGPFVDYTDVNTPPITNSNTLTTPPGNTVSAVAVNASTDTAHVVLIPGSGNGTAEIISGASTATPQTIATVIVGTDPGGIAADPGEGAYGTVFVANSGSKTVTAITG
jgi:hypothetical protein